MKIPSEIRSYLSQINLPDPNSHKGQNGKLLIIGGSELFHAASKWSLDIASKFVDMVFYSSVPMNNQLIMKAKANFWNGIVVSRQEVDKYVAEADTVLIGPGMERDQITACLVNQLLRQHPNQRWVIDAGALQMVDSNLLRSTHILTPHSRELLRLMKLGDDWKMKLGDSQKNKSDQIEIDQIKINQIQTNQIQAWLNQHHQPTLLLKGPIDQAFLAQKVIQIAGGNAGMTKGGTGDVLAGLVAALYCTHSADVSAVVGSFINKKAGESLYHRVGPYYNASDLVSAVPPVMWQLLKFGT